MKLLNLLMLIGLTLGISLPSQAQVAQVKHPRVAELESALSHDATEFLRDRVPNRPVMITVNIEANRKAEGERSADSGNLPYFDQFEEEVLDQWDDPKVPIRALMAKCRRIVVNASIAAELNSDELVEIKQTLFQRMGLTVGRDQVELIRRDWAQDKKGGDIWILAIIGGTVGVALIGLFIILYSSIGRIVKALPKAGSASEKGAGGGGNVSPAPVSLNEDTRRSSSSDSAPTGDLKFSDPIRLKEFITKSIHTLIEIPTFPSLEDMLQFERLAASSPGTLGALLSEFPIEKQKQIFSMSFSNTWLEGFHSPGELDTACLDALHKIFRRNRANEERKIEDLLIAVWRLEYKLETFIRSIPQEEAFSILGRLPKSIAVATARAAFPGSWGALLDPGFQPIALSAGQIKTLSERAQAQVPLRNFQLIESYKHDRELLEFLRVSDPAIEKDIYVASPAGSLIHELRPPFYKVLELMSDDLSLFAPQVSLDEWALAMMNLPKPQRRELEKTFNEKQRFMFVERLKHYDVQQPDKTKVGSVRDRIAWKFHDFSQKKLVALAEQTAAGNQRAEVQESDAA